MSDTRIVPRFTLDHPLFAAHTGRGVRVAVIDSGIHSGNPHIHAVSATYGITADALTDDATDRVGHGTAVAAAILEKAPAIELVAIRVFERTLATSAAVLARALEHAIEDGCRLINLSLGTPHPARASAFQDVVGRARRQGAIIVSAHNVDGALLFPGSMSSVAGAEVAAECARDELRLAPHAFLASGLPRPIPGVPPERNVQGISFAVANTTGFLARLLEAQPSLDNVIAIRDTLTAAAPHG